MTDQHDKYKIALAIAKIDVSDSMAALLYDLAVLIHKRPQRANIYDVTRIKRQHKQITQWSLPKHSENHMI